MTADGGRGGSASGRFLERLQPSVEFASPDPKGAVRKSETRRAFPRRAPVVERGPCHAQLGAYLGDREVASLDVEGCCHEVLLGSECWQCYAKLTRTSRSARVALAWCFFSYSSRDRPRVPIWSNTGRASLATISITPT